MVVIKITKPIPEKDICNKLNIKLIEGMGEKVQSSSWILKKIK